MIAPKTRQPSPQFIQREYEAVLRLAARLVTFASALPIETDSDINEQQEALASEDLISFSIHARRFVTAVGAISTAKACHLPLLYALETAADTYTFIDRHESTNVWDLLNIVVHNVHMEFSRTSFDIRARSATNIDQLAELVLRPRQLFRPKLIVRSDRSILIFVDLFYFFTVFLERVFNPAVEKCADNGIYLQKSLYD